MIRMPLASASLLAIAIALAGCGEGKNDKAAAPQAQAPAAASTTAAAPGAVDEAAGKAVVKHYAEMVYAVYSDSLSTAKQLQTAVDAFLAKPNDQTLKAAKEAWPPRAYLTCRARRSASATPSSTTGKAR
jgi:putative iron-regulated protein